MLERIVERSVAWAIDHAKLVVALALALVYLIVRWLEGRDFGWRRRKAEATAEASIRTRVAARRLQTRGRRWNRLITL